MSSPQADSLRLLVDRVLNASVELTPSQLAARLGVVDSYVSRLRSGWRPTRVREDLWARLAALDPERSHHVVREVGPAWEARSRDYFAGKQDTLMDVMRWVVDQQAEIGHHLRQHTIPASPSLEAVEEGAAALKQTGKANERAGKRRRA